MQARTTKRQAPSVVAPSNPDGPKYRQLADYFRARIESGELAPGAQLPTFAQMHTQHGASRPTVERMLLILESENLVDRQNGNGIFVARRNANKSARKPRSGIIGLSGEGFNFSEYSPYWAALMSGARDAASEAGMQLLILDDDSPKSWEKADGVLMCNWQTDRKALKIHASSPVVSLMTPVDGLCSVMADDEEAGYLATRHLIELGHRRIAFLHGYPNNRTAIDRLAGYRRALAEEGIVPSEPWMRCLHGKYFWGKRFTIEANRNMQKWLREDWNELGCTALICHNDEASLGAIQAFAEFGLRVPHDVSVIGFDGTEFCDLVTPSLSSVALPLREIGAAAARILLRQINKSTLSQEHQTFSVELQKRASTAAPLH